MIKYNWKEKKKEQNMLKQKTKKWRTNILNRKIEECYEKKIIISNGKYKSEKQKI